MESFNGNQACSVSWCSVPAMSKKPGAYCRAHYQRAYRGFDPEKCLVSQEWAKCLVSDCPHPVNAKGLCSYHGALARRGKLEAPEGMKVRGKCSVKDCLDIQEARGVCHKHYAQMRHWGLAEIDSEICPVDNCAARSGWSGFCPKHLRQANVYNLTLDEMNRVESVSECENPGCHNTVKFDIDHDHETGKVRGVLCHGCNTALGMLGDNPERILGLEKYLATSLTP